MIKKVEINSVADVCGLYKDTFKQIKIKQIKTKSFFKFKFFVKKLNKLLKKINLTLYIISNYFLTEAIFVINKW